MYRKANLALFIIIQLLIASCSSKHKIVDANELDGLIVIGFVLNAMTNKDIASKNAELLSSITLKNTLSEELYTIDLRRRNWGVVKVRPGPYCVSRVTTFVNVSIDMCKGQNFYVNSGQIRNMGYWFAGINYGGASGKIKLKQFDASSYTLNLYENAGNIYGDRLDEIFPDSKIINKSGKIVGFWYLAGSTDETYFFDDDGQFYSGYSLYKNGEMSLAGNWSSRNGTFYGNLKNEYGSFKFELYDDKLHVWYENKKKRGDMFVAYRNPFRTWDYSNEYNSVFADYNKLSLESVATELKKNVVIQIQFDTFEQEKPLRVGKRILRRVKNEKIVNSNVSSADANKILSAFSNWRFGSEFENKIVTLCMIYNEIPAECNADEEDTIVFRLGVRFPLK